MIDQPLHLRSAAFGANSYDPEARTFSATIATPTPVRRQDASGPYLEVLPAAAFDLSVQNLPVLDSHNTDSVRAILGRTESIRREGDQIVATIRLSSAEDVAPVGQRIADGSLSGLSIGYHATGWTTRREGGQRIRTAGRVALREVTMTSNPADPNAVVRQHQEADVPKDNIEPTAREALIARVRAAHDLPEGWAERMAAAEDELTDDEIRTDGRQTAQAARQTRTAPTIRTAAPANDDPAVTLPRMEEALAARMMGTAPSEAARPFMAMGLQDHAREALTRSGEVRRTMGAEEVLTRAMHGTSDFPELLTGAGSRVLAASYQAAQSSLKAIARQSNATDFRKKDILKLGEFSGLQKVSEHGEVKAMTTGETKEAYALETFAATFALSRKAIINDDLGAFGRWGEMMGRAAAETEAAQLVALLTQASGAGPVMGEDGKRLFHVDHGNVPGPSPVPANIFDVMSTARKALRLMKGLDGKTPVNVVPKFLLVHPSHETEAQQALAQVYAGQIENTNPFSGALQLLVEPRLPTGFAYVFADPATAPVLEYAYLSSAPGPQLSSRDGWDVLGREFRVVLDFGCGAVDWRGAYRHDVV